MVAGRAIGQVGYLLFDRGGAADGEAGLPRFELGVAAEADLEVFLMGAIGVEHFYETAHFFSFFFFPFWFFQVVVDWITGVS